MSNHHAHDRLRRLELEFIEIETITLSKAVNRFRLQPPFAIPLQPFDNPFLRRLVTQNLKSFSNEQNSNLFAYGYMLLVTIYDQFMNQNLLNLVKSLLYEESLDLAKIAHHPFEGLASNEIKKLMVEFIFELQFTDYSKTLIKTLNKYPVILYVLVMFLRTLLAKYGLEEANDYNTLIPTETAYEMLSELLDINYRNADHSYLFMESNCVIYEESPSLVFVGSYLESKPSSVSSSADNNANVDQYPPETQLLKLPSFDRKHQNFNFDSNIRESQYHDHDAPTPFFNLSSDHRDSNQEFKIEKKDNYLELNPYSSVPELKPTTAIVHEDDEYSVVSSQQNKSFEEKLIQLKNEENGWKSPIFNNGIILDDADNAFNAFQDANKEAFLPKNLKEYNFNPFRIETEEDSEEEEQCGCIEELKERNKLWSRVYEINILSMNRIHQEELEEPAFDCMILSIKNILSTQSSIVETNRPRVMNKAKRAHTYYEAHAQSYCDFDKSFQSVEPRSPKLNLNRTCTNLNSSYYSSKMDSRLNILSPLANPSKAPKIKFTYLTKKQ